MPRTIEGEVLPEEQRPLPEDQELKPVEYKMNVIDGLKDGIYHHSKTGRYLVIETGADGKRIQTVFETPKSEDHLSFLSDDNFHNRLLRSYDGRLQFQGQLVSVETSMANPEEPPLLKPRSFNMDAIDKYIKDIIVKNKKHKNE